LTALNRARTFALSQPATVVEGITYAALVLLAFDVLLRLAPHWLAAHHLPRVALLARASLLLVTGWLVFASAALDLTPRTARVIKVLAICYAIVMVVLIANYLPPRGQLASDAH
jgi:hypothetical protein